MPPLYGLVVMPLYNDWESCSQVIQALDDVLVPQPGKRYELMIIDDGSTSIKHELLLEKEVKHFDAIHVLNLHRNLGHQRAICIGLAYIHAHIECTVVILLDSDGEDDPRDVPRLLEQFEQEERGKIIFARRTKRSEQWLFRFFLFIYKVLHRLLTGRGISIGNFSLIPYKILSSLTIVPELWNHYAASVLHARLPYALVPSKREKRLSGHSKMNFTQLVIHGLSAISVYSEFVSTRILLAFSVLVSIAILLFAFVFSMLVFTNGAVPEWAAYSSGFLLILMVQSILFAIIFSVLSLNSRKHVGFIPARDYLYFVDTFKTLWKKN